MGWLVSSSAFPATSLSWGSYEAPMEGTTELNGVEG